MGARTPIAPLTHIENGDFKMRYSRYATLVLAIIMLASSLGIYFLVRGYVGDAPDIRRWNDAPVVVSQVVSDSENLPVSFVHLSNVSSEDDSDWQYRFTFIFASGRDEAELKIQGDRVELTSVSVGTQSVSYFRDPPNSGVSWSEPCFPNGEGGRAACAASSETEPIRELEASGSPEALSGSVQAFNTVVSPGEAFDSLQLTLKVPSEVEVAGDRLFLRPASAVTMVAAPRTLGDPPMAHAVGFTDPPAGVRDTRMDRELLGASVTAWQVPRIAGGEGIRSPDDIRIASGVLTWAPSRDALTSATGGARGVAQIDIIPFPSIDVEDLRMSGDRDLRFLLAGILTGALAGALIELVVRSLPAPGGMEEADPAALDASALRVESVSPRPGVASGVPPDPLEGTDPTPRTVLQSDWDFAAGRKRW